MKKPGFVSWVDDEGGKVKGGEISRFEIKVTHEAKLNEILHKINSIEIKLCSDGVKEFIKLLKSQSGMASKVAKKFDSKSKAFSKLTEYKYNQKEKRMTHSLRKALVGFVVSSLSWSVINKGLLHSDFLVKHGTLRLLLEALKLLDWTPSLVL
ncbi:hypothetical protein SO802_014618 [Lithocarpus litseifolius]|uniref:Homing endonuclease LAGLIDADG domain-containing protein n=1 Tax=Lithocarpus litseifolius TaxID=425828 RepID=A0AAW2CRZ0_9ROSI